MTILNNAIDPKTGLTISDTNNQQSTIKPSFKNIIDDPIGENIYLGSGVGDYSKDIGLDFMQEREFPNELEQQRSELQTGAELTGKFLGNMITEAGFGAVEGIGYALDFEDLFNTNNMAERDFDNWFSKGIREAKEGAQEDLFPIYQSEVAKHGTFGQKFGDPTWWASQGKTAGVTLGMIGTSLLAGGAGSMVGMGRNATMLFAGLTSAKVEGTMEASQKFQEDYELWKNDPELQAELARKYTQQVSSIDNRIKELSDVIYNPLDEGYEFNKAKKEDEINSLVQQRSLVKSSFEFDLEKQARERAGMAASKVYTANAIKAPLEVAQFMMLGRSFDSLRKGMKVAKATKAGMVSNALFQPATEAFEEVYQGSASKEATRSVRTGEQFMGSRYLNRMGEYAVSEEGKEAAFLGGAMGLLFDVTGTHGRKLVNNTKKIFKAQTEDPTITKQELSTKNKILTAGTMLTAYGSNDLDKQVELANSTYASQLEKEGLSSEDKESIIETQNSVNTYSEFIKTQDELLSEDPKFADKAVRQKYIEAKLESKIYNEEISKMDELVDTEVAESGLNSGEAEIYRRQVELAQLKAAKNDLVKNINLTTDEKVALSTKVDNRTAKLKTEISDLIAAEKATNPEFNPKKIAPNNKEQINKYTKEAEKYRLYNDVTLKDRLVKFNNLTQEESIDESSSAKAKDTRELTTHYKDRIGKENNLEVLTDIQNTLQSEYPEVYFSVKKELDGKLNSIKAEEEKTQSKERVIQSVNNLVQNTIPNASTPNELNKAKNVLNKLKLGKKETAAINALIDAKKAEITTESNIDDKARQEELNNAEEDWALNVDERGFPKESLQKINNKINAKYDALKNIQPVIESTDLSEVPIETDEVGFDFEAPETDDVIIASDTQPKTSEDKPIITDEIEDGLIESEEKADGTVVNKDNRLFQTESNVLLTTLAKEKKDIYIDNKKVGVEDVYVNNKVVLTENYDASIAEPTSFAPGSDVVLSVNESELAKIKNVTADNISISVMTIEDHKDGKAPFMHIRDLSNNKWTGMQPQALELTKAIRETIFKAYNKGQKTPFYTKVLSKDGGWTNKSQISVNLKDNLYNDNTWDDFSITSSDSSGKLVDKNYNVAINERVSPGVPHLLYKNANGNLVGSWLEQNEIKNNEGMQEFIDNSFDLIINRVLGEKGFENIDVHKEVGKYLHLRTFASDNDKNTEGKNGEYNNIFGFTPIDNNNFTLFLPNTKGYKLFKLTNTKDGLVVYHYNQNSTDPIVLDGGLEALKEQFDERLVNMYPNVLNEFGQNPDGFYRYKRNNEGLLVKGEVENYYQYLSDVNAVKTKIHSVLGKDGKRYFITQPNITISSEIKTSEEFGQNEVQPEQINDNDYNKAAVEEVKPTEVKVENSKRSRRSSKKGMTPKSDSGANLTVDNDINYNAASLSSFNKMDSIINENSAMSTLLEWMLDEFDFQRQEGNSVNMNSALDEILANISENIDAYNKYSKEGFDRAEAEENNVFVSAKANANAARNLEIIRDNFEEQLNNDGSVKFIGYRNKLNRLYKQLAFNAINEAIEVNNNEEGKTEGTKFLEGANYKTDPEKSMSAQIKRLLYNIPELDADGNTKSNIIGEATSVDYSKVFNYLMENLSNVAQEDMLSELGDLSKLNYIAKGVLSKVQDIQENNSDIFNKFISVMKKQRAKFVSVLFEKVVKNDKVFIKTKTIDINRTGTKDVIFNNWNSSYANDGLKSNLLEYIDGILTINTENSTKLYNEFLKSVKSLNTVPQMEDMVSILEEIGIDFDINAIKKLKSDFNSGNNKKHFKSMFGKSAKFKTFELFFEDAFGHIFSSFSKGLNPYEAESGKIKSLAIYEQKFNVDAFNQSFRDASGNMIYSFVNPHHLSNIVDKLNNNNEEYYDKINNDAFASKSTWLNGDKIELIYFDASKNNTSGAVAKNYEEQNDSEKEITKVSLYNNNNNKEFALTFTPSPSDKTTFSVIKAPRIDTTKDELIGNTLNLSKDTEDLLLDTLVMSEIDRINKTVNDFNEAKTNKNFDSLLEGYSYINDKVGAGAYFYLIPTLNEKILRSSDGSIAVTKDNLAIAREEIRVQLQSSINNKLEYWSKNDVIDNIDSKVITLKNGKVENLATEYVINSIMSYANQYMLFSGDPAQFAKIPKGYNANFNNWQTVMAATTPNMFKRIAKDIAPGYEGNFKDKEYRVAFIEEPKANSSLANDNEKSPYYNIDLADAQEWTTLDERVKVLEAIGKITNEQAANILKKSKTNDLTLQQIGIVMQPDKPVQTTSELDKDTGVLTNYYIKTSSFPLIPQVVERFSELKKMMDFMTTNKIDRLVPKSAVKLGFHNSINLFKDGVFNDNNNFNDKKVVTLSRDGFRIQQDVPFDANKQSILEGSQLRKLIHGDIESSYEFNLNGEPKTGVELKNITDDIHSEFYKRRFEDLINTLKVDDEFTIQDLSKLREMLVDEAIDRGYGDNDILMLNTMKLNEGRIVFKIPLFFHPNAHKIESLLNSLIKNKVLKNKLKGKSYVQGSSLGFNSATLSFLDKFETIKNGVVFTNDYKGDLDYRRDADGLYGEVLLPSFFKDAQGNAVDLTQYVKNGFLNTSKIDPEVLSLIGYRIPTQGFNSMIRLKVVGILPEIAGDLIIVPPAMVTQMGSDFDVDKLYIHRYNYESKGGKIVKTQSNKPIEKMSDEELQNNLLDIYNSILKNKEVGGMSQNPLDNDVIKDLVEGPLKPIEDAQTLSVLSDDLHTKMIDIQAAGQLGIGITSVASTSHSLAQYAGLYVKAKKVKNGFEYPSIMFNDKNDHNDSLETIETNGGKSYKPKNNTGNLNVSYSNHAFKGAWRLDKIKGFTNRLISSVITNIQTEAVDNANNGRLYPMHLNKHTFNVAMLIARAGFDEKTIGFFLNQPIIKRYVKDLSSLNNYTETEFVKNKKEKLQEQLLSEIEATEFDIKDISDAEMKDALNTSDLNTNLQKRILVNFIEYENIALELNKVQKSLNVDTKFLGKSFTDVVVRANNFDKNMSSNIIGNTYNLAKGTTAGSAVEFGVFKTKTLFGNQNLLPYDAKIFTDIFERFSEITGKDDLTEKDIEELTIGIRSSVWGDIIKKKFLDGEISVNNKRKELLFGDNTLAHRTIEAKNKYIANDFIQSLNPILPSDSSEPAVIEHYSGKDAKADYDFRKQKGWLDLLNHNKDSEEYKLGLDYAIYATTFGTKRTAKDFGRFLPVDFIFGEGIDKDLRDISFIDDAITTKLADNYIQQYLQHNPNGLPSITNNDIKGKISNEINPNKDFLALELPYIKYYDEASYNVHVYKLNNDKYVELDRLGEGFLTEFNVNAETATTVMKNNPKGVEIIDVQIIKQKLEKLEQQGGGENVLKSYKFDNGIESVLNSIKDSNSEQSGLAEYLLGKLDILSNVSLERYDYSNPDHYSKENDLMVRGKYLLSKNKILIHTAVIPNNKRFEQTFLHESIHALTHYLINTNNSDLTDAEIKAKEQLTKLYTTVKTKLETKYKDEFSNAFSNVDEFITESFTNKKFQELLNDTKIQGGSVWSKFINIVKGIFSNVKSGSALEKILTTGIQAIEVQTTTSEAKTKIELQKTLTQEELDEAEEYMKECEVGRKKVVNSKKSTKFGR